MLSNIKRYFTGRRWVVKRGRYGGLVFVSVALKRGWHTIQEQRIWKTQVNHDEIIELKLYILDSLNKARDNTIIQDSVCAAESGYLDEG